MFEYTWLNLGNIALGIMAWFLPTINLCVQDKSKNKNWSIIAFMSMTCCAISLYFQILYHSHLVVLEDWAALLDLYEGLNLAASVLIIVTVILNIITVIIYKNLK